MGKGNLIILGLLYVVPKGVPKAEDNIWGNMKIVLMTPFL
jgi:hypothetical protein